MSKNDLKDRSPREVLSFLQNRCRLKDHTERDLWAMPLEKQVNFRRKFLKDFFENERKAGKNRDEEAEEFIENEINEFLEFKKDPVTKYEDFDFYRIIKIMSKDVEEVAGDLGFKIDTEPVIGTLPTGEINAMSIKVPSGGFIVCVNKGTFGFMN